VTGFRRLNSGGRTVCHRRTCGIEQSEEKVSVVHSVYEMNCAGPMLEPCGTPDVRVMGSVRPELVVNTCVR